MTDEQKTLPKTFDPAELETRWYAHWEKNGLFRPERGDAEPFTIVNPPPNVTGVLHIGHALDNTLQDIIVRYERLRGKDALWVVGTDHAGIATQMVVERNMAAQGEKRTDLSRQDFMARVWAWKDDSGGQITRQLGDSLYSAFILIWMNKSSNSNWHTLWFAWKTGLVVSLLASHYAQLSFAYYLMSSIRQPHDSGDPLSDYCEGHDNTPVLKMLGVISFLSLCLGDLQATYDMHLWISMFKTSKTHEKLEVHRWVDTSNKLVKETKIYLPLTGITWFARFVFYTLVVIPKVVVAVCVATAGSGRVLRSGR